MPEVDIQEIVIFKSIKVNILEEIAESVGSGCLWVIGFDEHREVLTVGFFVINLIVPLNLIN